MTEASLIARQTALLRYLTDPFAFDGRAQDALLGPDRQIDRDRLRLIGVLGLRKREKKLRAVLPNTCRLLEPEFMQLVKAFAHVCPPISIRGLEVAEQFQSFLETRDPGDLNKPSFLLDLCRLEIAIGRVARPEEESSHIGAVFELRVRSGRRYRIRSGFETVKCSHDIRPLFDRTVAPEICAREILLAVFSCAGQPRIVEIAPSIFALLTTLKTLTAGPIRIMEGDPIEELDLLDRLSVVEAV